MNKNFDHLGSLDDMEPHYGSMKAPTLDEVLRDVKSHLNDDDIPSYDYGMDDGFYGQGAPVPAPQPDPEPVFEPDFGDAFRDYGTYSPEAKGWDSMAEEVPGDYALNPNSIGGGYDIGDDDYDDEDYDDDDYDAELKMKTELLIDMANSNGGGDNITIILIKNV